MKVSLLAGAMSLGLLAGMPAEAQSPRHAGHSAATAATPPAAPASPSGAMPGMDMPAEAKPPAPAPAAPPASTAPSTGDMPGMNMPAQPAPEPMDDRAMANMSGGRSMGHAMTGALGRYPMTREASGTAWQPDASRHDGIETMAGNWMLMGHGLLDLVYDRQSGPRGASRAFASGMAMAMAQRRFADGDVLQLKAMVSPDPLMGKSGYPLLLASGETANGVDPLIDRQHPHDLFMELSASYAFRLSEKASLFLYGGLPGEPAFGPPAFMHRQSILDSPEAPITHHWLDSTHITFGVVTAGLVLDRFKFEASRFNGREPDQYRYDIETGPLDSTSLRISVNPTAQLSLQASWAHLEDPEQLAPGENQTRWSTSAIYTRPLGKRAWWSTTLAWGRRRSGHENFDAAALESAVGLGPWTLFGRGEYTENDELLFVGGHHGPTFEVGKVSLGLIRDFRVREHLKLGIGGLYAVNFVPRQLDALYAGDARGAMAFVRLKIE